MFALLTMTACSDQPTIRYVDKPYAVNIPVKCIVPDVDCTFNRETDTEVIASMLECVVELKRASEVCK
jgi:hypothetical protein